MRDILAYHIPSMAHVLEGFNPYNPSPLYCFDELIEPKFLHELEIAKREEENDWGKY